MIFTRQNCGAIAAEIMAAVQDVATKHGIKIEREGGGKFDANKFSFKIQCVSVGEGGENLAAKRDFELLAWRYGLDASHFNAEFKYAGKLYRLDGINPRARAWPFNVTNVNDPSDRKRLPPEAAAIIKSQVAAAA